MKVDKRKIMDLFGEVGWVFFVGDVSDFVGRFFYKAAQDTLVDTVTDRTEITNPVSGITHTHKHTPRPTARGLPCGRG